MKVIVVLPLLLAAVIGGVLLYIGFQHNSQGEFVEQGHVHYAYAALIFTTNLVAAWVTLMVPIGLVMLARRFLGGKKRVDSASI